MEGKGSRLLLMCYLCSSWAFIAGATQERFKV